MNRLSVTSALVGRLIAERYRVEALISRGPVGATYAIDDRWAERALAIHVLWDAPAPDARFHRNIERLTMVRDPAVAVLHGAIALDDDTPALITERTDTESLATRVARGPLRVEVVRTLLLDLACGLSSAHWHGVAHLDLRPEHVRITRDGGVKLTHLGLATLCSERAAPTFGEVVYAHPQYTAPEQWVDRRADAATDVYALGLLGYLALTGEDLIPRGAPTDTCAAHFTADRPRLREAASGEPVPAALADAIWSAAQPNRDARYADASGFAEDLRAAATKMTAELRALPPGARSSYNMEPGRSVDFTDLIDERTPTPRPSDAEDRSINMTAAEFGSIVIGAGVLDSTAHLDALDEQTPDDTVETNPDFVAGKK